MSPRDSDCELQTEARKMGFGTPQGHRSPSDVGTDSHQQVFCLCQVARSTTVYGARRL